MGGRSLILVCAVVAVLSVAPDARAQSWYQVQEVQGAGDRLRLAGDGVIDLLVGSIQVKAGVVISTTVVGAALGAVLVTAGSVNLVAGSYKVTGAATGTYYMPNAIVRIKEWGDRISAVLLAKDAFAGDFFELNSSNPDCD